MGSTLLHCNILGWAGLGDFLLDFGLRLLVAKELLEVLFLPLDSLPFGVDAVGEGNWSRLILG